MVSVPLTDLLNKNFDHLAKRHPCFHGEAHTKYGRIHLPVSPRCNIQCRFCKRGFNKWENRPGVSRGIVKPEEAAALVRRALDLCPEITVVGIAGPGDTLATDHALDTFALIDTEFPHLLKCLSTNGLLLATRAKQIAEVGVDSVTVTVNASTPDVLQQIVSWVRLGDKIRIGLTAGELLIKAQLDGIEAVARRGVVVKINTVLVPGVNEHQVGEIARTTGERGASIINIIPLIPQFDMAHIHAPDCRALERARVAASPFLTVFRHCRQCRADACGIPGTEKDFAGHLYDQMPMTFSHG